MKFSHRLITPFCLILLVGNVIGCGMKSSLIYTTGGEGSFGENPGKPGAMGRAISP